MTERWRKDDPDHKGESFFSHKQDGGWCNGKPPRPSSNAIQSEALDLIIKKLDTIDGRIDKLARFLESEQGPF